MKNKNRKEDLKQLALKKMDNGGRIYQLINSNKLDKIIDLITDEKTPAIKTTLVEKGYLTANEQFIDMLSNFLYYFDMNFPSVGHKDLMIQFILESQTPEFLLCKKYWGDNNNIPYFTKEMDKAIVNNFYNNVIFTDDYKTFQKYKIFPHKMNLEDRKDLNTLIKFMKDIAWTNYNDYSLVYLFDEFGEKERVFSKTYKNKGKLEIYRLLMDDYRMHFDILISHYEDKKELLKIID